MRAGLVIVLAEAFGLLVAFAWPGSYLDAACYSFIAANCFKVGMLAVLFPRQYGAADRKVQA